MTTKEKLLELFEAHKGTFFSGEDIAKNIGCSRTAVWKAVQGLRNDGYNIEAVPNKGYSLAEDTDIVSAQGIQKYLKPLCTGLKIPVLPVVDSTNTYIREHVTEELADGYTVLANKQTSGKGRLGRSFFSPEGTGVYLSMLLRPQNYSAEQAMRITTIASVAACEAIEEVSGKTASIKWVNDVYIANKKAVGILTEASFGLENGLLDYAVLGVGFNAYTPSGGFPDELKDIICAVFDNPAADGKNRLAAAFLNHFMEYYKAENPGDYIEKYRKKSMVIGNPITVYKHGLPTASSSPSAKAQSARGSNGTPAESSSGFGTAPNSRSAGGIPATALDIDSRGGLVVRYEDGTEETLSSGEISIRLRN